jgi:hypothetical protein
VASPAVPVITHALSGIYHLAGIAVSIRGGLVQVLAMA